MSKQEIRKPKQGRQMLRREKLMLGRMIEAWEKHMATKSAKPSKAK
jgi:hypothetical protein